MATFDTNTYDYLDRIRISVAFTTVAGVAVDPAVVTVRYLDPSGNVTVIVAPDPLISNPSVGNYYTDIDIDEEGRYYYRWEGTGAGAQGAAEHAFEIRETQFY